MVQQVVRGLRANDVHMKKKSTSNKVLEHFAKTEPFGFNGKAIVIAQKSQ